MSEVEDRNSIMAVIANQNGDEFRSTHQITISGFEMSSSSSSSSSSVKFKCPDPMVSFNSTPFAAPIRSALSSAGFTAPTPTQAQSCMLLEFPYILLFTISSS